MAWRTAGKFITGFCTTSDQVAFRPFPYTFETEHGVQKIILSGDSAGGNLAVALTLRLIHDGDILPDGVLVFYPALRVEKEFFTPSFLFTLEDGLLPSTVAMSLKDMYVKPDQNTHDPFLSPIYAPDEWLRHFPPTEIYVGNKDFLHDDCVRLTERLKYLFLPFLPFPEFFDGAFF